MCTIFSSRTNCHIRSRFPERQRYAVGVRAQKQQKFRGVLEPDGTSLKWTILKVPFDPGVVWPKRNRLRVRGTIRGVDEVKQKAVAGNATGCAFRTSLFRARGGGFFLLVNKQMQKGARVTLGSVAEVTLEPDLDERVLATPLELEKLLQQNRGLKKWHEQLSESYRKAFSDRVIHVKSPEAKRARAEQLAEMMMLAMEGERVTPPILEAAFLRQPKAREGWRAMTPVQRRGHLMGIFYYQSPESRQKRAQKAIDEAVRAAGRAEGRRRRGD